MFQKHKIVPAIMTAMLVAAGCAKKESHADQSAAPAAAAAPSAPAPHAPSLDGIDFKAVADAAVADPARPAEDRDDDDRRKTVESLVFMRVAPGLTIFEIEAGAGWYTELFSHAVGPTGKVYMHNPPSFLEFVSEKIDARLDGGRLANVTSTATNFDELEAADQSVDLVTWVHGPHELYFKPGDGVTLGDPRGAYAEIYRILKHGGSFVAIDHSAVMGANQTVGNDLHRVDKTLVIERATEAGFRLAAESDFLANPKDDRKLSVFDPKIKGYTDQFALRFVKD